MKYYPVEVSKEILDYLFGYKEIKPSFAYVDMMKGDKR